MNITIKDEEDNDIWETKSLYVYIPISLKAKDNPYMKTLKRLHANNYRAIKFYYSINRKYKYNSAKRAIKDCKITPLITNVKPMDKSIRYMHVVGFPYYVDGFNSLLLLEKNLHYLMRNYSESVITSIAIPLMKDGGMKDREVLKLMISYLKRCNSLSVELYVPKKLVKMANKIIKEN